MSPSVRRIYKQRVSEVWRASAMLDSIISYVAPLENMISTEIPDFCLSQS